MNCAAAGFHEREARAYHQAQVADHQKDRHRRAYQEGDMDADVVHQVGQ
jgi:hypothetical protein